MKIDKKIKVELIKDNYHVHQTPMSSFYKELEQKEKSIKELMRKEWRV